MKINRIRILISSPGDVEEERNKAKEVIHKLQKRYAEQLVLEPVLWEDLPLLATNSFQHGIDLILDKSEGIDVAIFILWSRLGTPLGSNILHPEDGTEYQSGTEREFDLMLRAYLKSGKEQRPKILAYVRDDPKAFLKRMEGKNSNEQQSILDQRKLAENFIQKHFYDSERGFNIGAYYTFPKPITFSHMLRTHLKQTLDSINSQLVAASWEGSPFRGLEVFDSEHEQIFFGRDDAICDIQNKLRTMDESGCAFVLIVGASGSGKSSLARAGIIPAVSQFDIDDDTLAWRSCIFIPGKYSDDLCIGLIKVIADNSVLPELNLDSAGIRELGEALKENPETAYNLKIKDAINATTNHSSGKARILLLIDQMEELFTLASVTKKDRTQFLKSIQTLAQSGEFWIIGTIRNDFYAQVQDESILMQMKDDNGQYDLLLPTPAQIRSIIFNPARLAGLCFEVEKATRKTLDQKILDEAVLNPESMPMLEFLLKELYENRSSKNVLLISEYNRLGGVEGAIGQHAEAVFQSLPAITQSALPRVLSQLVTFNENDQDDIARHRAEIDYFNQKPTALDLIKIFIDERLFISDAGNISVVHEALLRNWERAANWVKENQEFLRVRTRVIHACKQWESSNKPEDLLLAAGKSLTEAQALLNSHFYELDSKLKLYIEQSSAFHTKKQRERKRVRRKIVISLSFLSILAFMLGSWALFENRKATIAALKKESREKLFSIYGIELISRSGGGFALRTTNKHPELVTDQNWIEIATLAEIQDSVTEIELRYCDNITMFSTFGKFPDLEQLTIDNSGQLTKIDLSSNHRLKTLKIINNANLKSISGLKDNVDLQHLIINECAVLSDLDIESLPKLETFEAAMCYNLKKIQWLENSDLLLKLNLARCPVFKQSDLRLFKNLKHLKDLDLSYCSSLENLEGLRNCIDLEYLYLEYCESLKDVMELKHLKKLKTLWLTGCPQVITIQALLDSGSELENIKTNQNAFREEITKLKGRFSDLKHEFPTSDVPVLIPDEIKGIQQNRQ